MAKDNNQQPKKPANLTTFMLSQDFLPEHWDWDDQEKKILAYYANTPDAAREVGKIILNRIIANGLDVSAAYAIMHDKDEHIIWSEYQNKYISNFTSHHIHFVAKLKKGETLERIASIIGVEPNFIEKPQRGRYSFDNMLSYLIHIKYPAKYRYNAREVVTFVGKDYFDYYAENHKQWMHGRAERIVLESRMTLHDVEMLIMDDKLTKQELVTNPEYKYVYQLHRERILKLLDTHKKYMDEQKEAESGVMELEEKASGKWNHTLDKRRRSAESILNKY